MPRVLLESPSRNASREREEKLFRHQEQSAICYGPITTKLSLVVAHVDRVPRMMFESPGSNARRDRHKKLPRPQDYSALCYCPSSTKLALLVASLEVEICSSLIYESLRCKSEARLGRKALSPPRIKCPLLLPVSDQTYSGCGACGGSTTCDILSHSAAMRGEKRMKNCFGLKNKVPFISDPLQPNLHCLWRMRRACHVAYVSHPTAIWGEIHTKNSFAHKSKVPFLKDRFKITSHC
jgi:hypothetical protein